MCQRGNLLSLDLLKIIQHFVMCARGAVVEPLCNPIWGKYGIGTSGDSNPDLFQTGGSGLLSPLGNTEETEAGPRSTPVPQFIPAFANLSSSEPLSFQEPRDSGPALDFDTRTPRTTSSKVSSSF